MTISDSLHFTFNSIRSKNLNMLHVTLDGGMQEEYFASPQKILEEKTRHKNKPYFYGVEKEPLRLTVNIAFEDQWDDLYLREVRRWLTEPDYYAPLIFSNNPEKIYYAIYIDEPKLLHNSNSQGYITLNFRCNDSYAYTPLTTSPIYHWDKESYSEIISNFSTGEKKSLVTDENGYLTLNPHRTKWSDFPLGTRLCDLN